MPPPAPLNRRTIALVGLMGVGKTSIGRRLASALGMPFKDADGEIVEAAAGRSINDIFAQYGRGGVPRRRTAGDRQASIDAACPPRPAATGGGSRQRRPDPGP